MPRREPKLRLGPAVGSPGQTCVEVDRFRASALKGVLHADALRLRRINPAGEGQQAIGYEQRIIVDDIIDPRLCRQRAVRAGTSQFQFKGAMKAHTPSLKRV